MRTHFMTMAAYNRWANRRLYQASATLSDDAYRADRGAFFRSLHGTLNHILVADRMWLHRLTGTGHLPSRLSEILYDDLVALTEAREAEDERIIAVVGSLGDADWHRVLNYRRANGEPAATAIGEILAHFFNHHAHHRGQAHAILTGLGRDSPDLDLSYYFRERY